MDAIEVLKDAYGRLPELVRSAIRELTPEQLCWAPAPGANSIGWLVWHLTRVQDGHVAELLDTGQIYADGVWAPRFGRPAGSSDTGYGHGPDQVATVRPDDWRALDEYFTAVYDRTLDYLDSLSESDLDRVVDKAWDPPVTLGVRLVSVVDDCVQHVGQAAYVRGILP
jgi:uncharacterized damage-inducible protein DinB